MYGLKQAPKVRYEKLSTYLGSKGFRQGKIDPAISIKIYNHDIFIAQVYVDDIFKSTNSKFLKNFINIMESEF